MVAGVAAAIDADHEAGARGISLRKTLMIVAGGDDHTMRRNEMRGTSAAKVDGMSRKPRQLAGFAARWS